MAKAVSVVLAATMLGAAGLVDLRQTVLVAGLVATLILLAIDAIQQRRARRGYVYVLTGYGDGRYKLGRTTKPEQRLARHRTTLENAEYLKLWEVDDMYRAESDLLRRYDRERQRGRKTKRSEVVRLTPKQVAEIRRLKL